MEHAQLPVSKHDLDAFGLHSKPEGLKEEMSKNPAWLNRYLRKAEKAKGAKAHSPSGIEAIKKAHSGKPQMCIAILPDSSGHDQPMVINGDSLKVMSAEARGADLAILDRCALEAMEREMKSQKTAPPKKPIEDMSWEERHNQVLSSLINMKEVCKELRRVNQSYKSHITGLQETIKAYQGIPANEVPRSQSQTDAAELRRYRSRCKKLGETMRDIHAIVNGFRDRTSIRQELRDLVWEKYAVVMKIGTFVQCCHCGKLLKEAQMSVEHLKPRVLGGTDDLENLRGACFPCNWDRPVEDISHKFFTVVNLI